MGSERRNSRSWIRRSGAERSGGISSGGASQYSKGRSEGEGFRIDPQLAGGQQYVALVVSGAHGRAVGVERSGQYEALENHALRRSGCEVRWQATGVRRGGADAVGE